MQGGAMELDVIVSMLEEALRDGIEPAMRSIRAGEDAAALANLERVYAEVSAAVDALRTAPPLRPSLPGMSG